MKLRHLQAITNDAITNDAAMSWGDVNKGRCKQFMISAGLQQAPSWPSCPCGWRVTIRCWRDSRVQGSAPASSGEKGKDIGQHASS